MRNKNFIVTVLIFVFIFSAGVLADIVELPIASPPNTCGIEVFGDADYIENYIDMPEDEHIFPGTLVYDEIAGNCGIGTLMRCTPYQIKGVNIYTGNTNLTDYIGKDVMIIGKKTTFELEGQILTEIWPRELDCIQQACEEAPTVACGGGTWECINGEWECVAEGACVDTDDYKDIYTKGSCSDFTGTIREDICHETDNMVGEMYCTNVGNECARGYLSCPEDYICRDGACVQDTPEETWVGGPLACRIYVEDSIEVENFAMKLVTDDVTRSYAQLHFFEDRNGEKGDQLIITNSRPTIVQPQTNEWGDWGYIGTSDGIQAFYGYHKVDLDAPMTLTPGYYWLEVTQTDAGLMVLNTGVHTDRDPTTYTQDRGFPPVPHWDCWYKFNIREQEQTCPAKIDLVLSADDFREGMVFSFKVILLDKNGSPMRNQEFYASITFPNGETDETKFTTDERGIFTESNTIHGVEEGMYTLSVYTISGNCQEVRDVETFYIFGEGGAGYCGDGICQPHERIEVCAVSIQDCQTCPAEEYDNPADIVKNCACDAEPTCRIGCPADCGQVDVDVDPSVFMDMAFKLEGMRMQMITYQDQAESIRDFYLSHGMYSDADRYTEVIVLFNNAIGIIDETKDMLSDNLDNPKIAKHMVRENLIYVRDIIKKIVRVMLTTSSAQTYSECGPEPAYVMCPRPECVNGNWVCHYDEVEVIAEAVETTQTPAFISSGTRCEQGMRC